MTGYWVGWFIGLIVALVVAVGIVSAFDIQFPWTIIIGGVCGFVFTMIGSDIGERIDERDGY